MPWQSRDVGLDQCRASARIGREGRVSVYSRPAEQPPFHQLTHLHALRHCPRGRGKAGLLFTRATPLPPIVAKRGIRICAIPLWPCEIHDVGQPHIKWHSRLERGSRAPRPHRPGQTHGAGARRTFPRVRPRPPFRPGPCKTHRVCASRRWGWKYFRSSQTPSATTLRALLQATDPEKDVADSSKMKVRKARETSAAGRDNLTSSSPRWCASQNENQLLELLIRCALHKRAAKPPSSLAGRTAHFIAFWVCLRLDSIILVARATCRLSPRLLRICATDEQPRPEGFARSPVTHSFIVYSRLALLTATC